MEKVKKGVRLEHISKIYQDPKTGKDFYAVKDNSLTIAPGEFVTLLGPSGCGKTTGDSDYEVHPDTDLQNYIAEEFAKEENQQALADKNGITPDEIVSGKVS